MPQKTGHRLFLRHCSRLVVRHRIKSELKRRLSFQNMPDDCCELPHHGDSCDFRTTTFFDRLMPVSHRFVFANSMNHREIQDMPGDSTSRLRDQRKYVGSQLELPLR